MASGGMISKQSFMKSVCLFKSHYEEQVMTKVITRNIFCMNI
jgi:hypothetical protein